MEDCKSDSRRHVYKLELTYIHFKLCYIFHQCTLLRGEPETLHFARAAVDLQKVVEVAVDAREW